VVRDGYGKRAEPTAAVVPFGYTGHAEDPVGLVWGRARYMEPSVGGWALEDPVGSQPRYCYVHASPAVATDPSGRAEGIEYGIMARFDACVGVGVAALAGAMWGGNIGALSTGYESDGLGFNPVHEAAGGCLAGALGPEAAASEAAMYGAAAGGFLGAFLDAVSFLDWYFKP
jgi:RHS repeat-associated protein